MCSTDKSTNAAALHIKTQHNRGEDGLIKAAKPTKSIAEMLQRPQAGNLLTRFDLRQFRQAYMRWVLLDDVSFRSATSANSRNLFETAAPIVSRFIPQSHSTVPAWLDSEYYHAQAAILATLQAAVSRVYVSFDVWTSNHRKAYLGVIAYFLDASYTRRNALLTLPRLRGHHDHPRIANKLLDMLQKYDLVANECARLGYFIADNHNVNDAALEALSKRLPAINHRERRLRCANHISNF